MDSALISGRESADISERESIYNFFDHLVFYLLECEHQLPSSVIRHSQLTDSIAFVVRIFIRRLIRTRSFQEIRELLSQSEDTVSRYVLHLSGYLIRFVPRNCLAFLAKVCLIYICYSGNSEIRRSAVDCLMMFIYWRRDQFVKQLDSAAREILENGDFHLVMELID